MKSLKPVAALSVASALALTGCSAGQITQTSSQVAAVDGATGFTENRELSVQDVTVVLDENGQAALKFVATNQDRTEAEHQLVSAEVDGAKVNLGSAKTIGYNCNLVADSQDGLDRIPEAKDACIQYVPNSVQNKDFAYGGNVPVKFNFDAGSIEVTATVSAPGVPSGEREMDFTR
ncbi:hypothetical protein [Corynebacterium bouchesdurhonense]|uniref:hypothetical protein n=1 Tax=Corynebacterium bouchesdurhonense TaxID=1720192 RepID=UPI000ADB1971|nr:hypothetical protein [Corynebacterium bouchesdurhonense]